MLYEKIGLPRVFNDNIMYNLTFGEICEILALLKLRGVLPLTLVGTGFSSPFKKHFDVMPFRNVTNRDPVSKAFYW